ncbi:MAG: hypothetical protein GY898_18510 [Proteobacteria bacterium]|nr:hypothetical protein [Pseudomonadota bacterium]
MNADVTERMRKVREHLAATDPELLRSLPAIDDPLLQHSLSLTPRQRLRQSTALLRSLDSFKRVQPTDG